MIKTFFNAIYRQIKSQVPEVKHVDIWNENISALSGGAVWPVPAVFVSIEPLAWIQEGGHVRRSDVSVGLHLIQRDAKANGFGDKRMKETMQRLDLVEKIQTAMSSLNGESFSTFQLQVTQLDQNHGELIEDLCQFSTRVKDTSSEIIQKNLL